MRSGILLLGCCSWMAATVTAASMCDSDVVAEYMDLADYRPAISFCENNYPNFTTSTVVTTCTPSSDKQARSPPSHRQGGMFGGGNFRPQSFGPSSSSSSPQEEDPSPSDLLASLTRSSPSIVSAVCSCVSHKTTTYKTLTCAPWETCDPSTLTCAMTRDCRNPARCDSSSYCGTSAAGVDMFCHPDTDDLEAGYCMSGTPGCPAEGDFEDCESNADCGGEKVCIYACCREEPFCIDVREYKGLPTGGPWVAG